MVIELINNSSEQNRIGKNLTIVRTLEGSIKEPSSVTNPVITIEYDSAVNFNYCHIPLFNRYYFVNDITVIHNNLIRISLNVDVLESFKDAILTQNVIIERSASNYDMYLPDEDRIINVKTKTDIINFPSGLLENGEFILITAGG